MTKYITYLCKKRSIKQWKEKATERGDVNQALAEATATCFSPCLPEAPFLSLKQVLKCDLIDYVSQANHLWIGSLLVLIDYSIAANHKANMIYIQEG